MTVRRNARLRTLDRWAGIPLVALLGAIRRKRTAIPRDPGSIAFLKVAAIGDTLLMSSIVQDARASWPAAVIRFFAGEDNVAAARLIPGVDEVIPIAVARPTAAVRAMRTRPIDLLIDCGPWPRLNAVLAALSGAGFTVGFRTPGQYRHFAYDRTAEHSHAAHEVENYRAVMRLLGVAPAHAPSVTAPAIREGVLPRGAYVVLHMWSAGTGGWQKEWAVERWIEVARALAGRGMEVLVSGGPGDVERSAAFADEIRLPGVRSIAGAFSLAEMAGVLAKASLLVSVNTGIMHLGAILGTPTISLEGPTPVSRWGPVGPHVRSVSTRLPGCGFLHLGFEYGGQRTDCMQGVEVGDVMAAIDEMLRDAPAGRGR